MKHLIILFTLVILEPYKGINYQEINAYYFDNEIKAEEYTFQEQIEPTTKYKEYVEEDYSEYSDSDDYIFDEIKF